MADLLVDLDDAVIDRLRRRATRNGRSLNAEMLAILGEAVAREPDNEKRWATKIQADAENSSQE